MSNTPSVTSRRGAEVFSSKIVILGESDVGKSSIALRFCSDEFRQNQETTIGAAYLTRTMMIPHAAGGGNRLLKFEIWDTAGQERYSSLAPMYYRGALGALVVYDITSNESLGRAHQWIEELRANGDASLQIFLVGNKMDLELLRQVKREDAAAMATQSDLLGHMETSAKDNVNVEELFTELGKTLLEKGLAKSSATAAPNQLRNGGPATLDGPTDGNGQNARTLGLGCC